MVVVVVVAGVEGTILVFVFKNDATSSFGSFFSLILSPYSENFFLLALDSRIYIYIWMYISIVSRSVPCNTHGCSFLSAPTVFRVAPLGQKPQPKRFLSLDVADECWYDNTSYRDRYTTFFMYNFSLPLKLL